MTIRQHYELHKLIRTDNVQVCLEE